MKKVEYLCDVCGGKMIPQGFWGYMVFKLYTTRKKGWLKYISCFYVNRRLVMCIPCWTKFTSFVKGETT